MDANDHWLDVVHCLGNIKKTLISEIDFYYTPMNNQGILHIGPIIAIYLNNWGHTLIFDC